MQRIRLIWICLYGDVEKFEGLGEPLLSIKDQAAQIGRVRIVRAQAQGVLEAEKSLVGAVEIDQQRSEILPVLRVSRFERYGFFNCLERLLVPARSEQRRCQCRQIIRSRVTADRAGSPLNGVVVLLGLQGQQAQQVQAVRVISVRRERLLTVELRVENAAG